ncbi:MAG: ABC transporter permease [Hyphomicrobiaceae bacterium]|nr:MAG: ABC transporter permease [Hyphomicrobiaceae bacterium]
MAAFVIRRILATIPVLGMVAVIVFLILRLTPGDPATLLAGDNATLAQIEEIRRHLGLDRSIVVQFVSWIGHLLRGDFGESFFFKMPVAALIADRIQPTLSLALMTLIFTIVIAVPMGVIAANRRGTWVDHAVMTFSVGGFSIPVFVLGYLLIYVFAIRLNWFPVQGFKSFDAGIRPFLSHLLLPSLTLSVVYIALVARIARASVIEVLNEDYIRTAYSKGLTNRVVLTQHALRNAAIPIVTVIGMGVALLIGGAVVIESVYNIPGLGRLTVDAVLSRDYPTIQAMVLLFSFIYVMINMLVDLSYAVLDPRIRY